jgi:hypothetical protein
MGESTATHFDNTFHDGKMHAALLPISAKIIIFTIFPSQFKTWESEKADALAKTGTKKSAQKGVSQLYGPESQEQNQ